MLRIARRLLTQQLARRVVLISRLLSTTNTSLPSQSDHELIISILESALKHVPKYGWTIEALAAGAQDSGLLPISHGILAKGPADLVEYYVDKCNRELKLKIQQRQDFASLTVRDQLTTALRTRLELSAPMIAHLPQALGILTLPSNIPMAMKLLGQLVDDVWFLCGDRSTDWSWYTKRAVLGGVYTSTELYMLTDQSAGFKDTWGFLERRLDEVVQLQQLKWSVTDGIATALDGLRALLPAFPNPFTSSPTTAHPTAPHK